MTTPGEALDTVAGSVAPPVGSAADLADANADADTDAARIDRAWALVAAVPDPEIPVVTLADLGILRDVRLEDGRIRVVLTPTYVGCPATEAIREEVLRVLAEHGLADARVEITLSPPWTTDWISDVGRERLRAYGIAPPHTRADGAAGPPGSAGTQTAMMREQPVTVLRAQPAHVACPHCGSRDTERLAAFGSTPCKALHRCRACREPFDHFKPY